jgi:serine protease Do
MDNRSSPRPPSPPGTRLAPSQVDGETVNRRQRSPLLRLAMLFAGASVLVPTLALADGDPGDPDAPPEAVQEQTPPGQPPAVTPAPKKPSADVKAKKGDKAPADKTAAGDKADDAADEAKKQAAADDKAIRGIVTIERAGQTIALGGVLAGDGRILTALSPLGPGNDLEARFADGSTARVKLGHHDRMWDLALLVPQTGKWADGLVASSRDPVRQDAFIKSFGAAKGKVTVAAITLRSHRTLLGGDDKPIENAIEIGSRISPTDLGSPLIDEDGRVVGVLGRGCAPNENKPCTPVAFGAPIAAIKSFLRTVPPTAVPPAAWLGIQGEAEVGAVVKGVRVLSVHPESPADEAHLKGGDKATSDLILAVDGVPVTTPEALSDAIRAHGVGEKVPLMVFSQGKYRTVTVLLRPAPGEPSSAPAPAHPAELPALEPSTPPAKATPQK